MTSPDVTEEEARRLLFYAEGMRRTDDIKAVAAALAEARAERDELKLYKINIQLRGSDRLLDQLEAAEAEVTRLREALVRYGKHRSHCRVLIDGHECACGFAALSAAPLPVTQDSEMSSRALADTGRSPAPLRGPTGGVLREEAER